MMARLSYATLSLLIAGTPAFAQEAAEPARTPAQQLIHDAANGQPVRQPDSMSAPAPAPNPPSNWDDARPAFPALPLASEEAAAPEPAAATSEGDTIEARVAALTPGEFLWMPERQTTGPVVIVVSLAEQMVYTYRGGELIGVSTASTGMASHPTPTGSFTILQKRRRHFSNLYNNAPMPNMQRLTWDGIAFHAGALPGHPASHGCIRLPMAFSNHLFVTTAMGGRVHIIGESPPSAAGALAYVRSIAGESASR